MRPLQHQTWETFSVNWHTDVRIAFHWLREALLKPLRPGSRVVMVSSGAALAGSPLSGGYAGAKATQRFITAYAQDEAERAGLDITFTAVLPRITPLTDLGRPGVQASAARSGQTEEEYLQQFGEPLTPEAAGAAVVELVRADAATVAPRLPAHRGRTAEAALTQKADNRISSTCSRGFEHAPFSSIRCRKRNVSPGSRGVLEAGRR